MMVGLRQSGIWRDLGVNLLTDAITLALGVFAVDRLIKRREADRARPALRAAWRSAWRTHDGVAGFVEMALDGSDSLRHVADVRAAAEDQDRRYLPRALETVIFDREDPSGPARRGEGRMAVDAYLVRAMTEADRFMARFVNVAPPELVALIERLESSQLVVSAMRNGIALRRIHCEVWAEFLDIEHELKGLVAQADFDHDLLPPWPMRPVVSEEVRRWERPTPGWTATGRRPLEVPRTPRSELPNLRFDPE